MTKKPSYPPDYVDLDGLAYRLSLTPDYVRQLVKRHRLPQPVMFGEAQRWRWSDVEARMNGVADDPNVSSSEPDLYMSGVSNGAETASTRPQGHG
jgi:predicted DNA-binding transcriptional regulator AlpA